MSASDVPAIVLELSEPVQFGSETVTTLRLREPRGRDIRRLKSDPTCDDLLSMAARLSGYPDKVIDDLAAKDAIRLIGELGPLLGGSAEPASSDD